MKVEFIVSYPICLFDFVDYLSLWAPHVPTYFYKEYEKKLTEKQKKLLSEYREIRKNNIQTSEFKIEFCRKRTLSESIKTLKENLTPKETKKAERIFLEFDRLYKPIFLEKENHLLAHRKSLEQIWKPISNKCLTALEELFDTKWPEKGTFEIFLPYHSGKETDFEKDKIKFISGGANIGKMALTIDIHNYKVSEKLAQRRLAVLIHELTHAIYRTNTNTGHVIKYLLEHKFSPARALQTEEAIVDSFAPAGYLTQELFGTKPKFKIVIKKESYQRIARDIIRRYINPLSKNYYKHRKQQNFWKDYLPKVAELIK